MNIEGLVLIEVFGEGYYSGQTQTCSVVVEKDFVEEYVDDFKSVWFHELDGKHSQVEGDVALTKVTQGNIQAVISALLNTDGDDYIIWESLLDGIDEGTVSKQVRVNEAFNKRIKCETVTKYYLDGEEL